MAQKVTVRLVDDLDGTEAEETVSFGVDGASYEIDLSDANANRLRDVLAEFVNAGRRTGGRVKRGRTNGAAAPVTTGKAARNGHGTASARDIREWAMSNGFNDMADRGRIPIAVQEAYREANA